MSQREFNGSYAGEHLNKVAFPLGGIGAGMFCVEGTGAFSHLSLRHHPDVSNEPLMFATLACAGDPAGARILEGPVPGWKIFGQAGAGNGLSGKTYGLPRCAEATCEGRFPFLNVSLKHPHLPLEISLAAWSPFAPGDADNSSLPAAVLEYTFTNTGAAALEASFGFHAGNFMAQGEGAKGVSRGEGGFVLWQEGTEEKPWDEGYFAGAVDDAAGRVDCHWFRGQWFDGLTMLWKEICSGEMPAREPVSEGQPSPGGSLYVPLALGPGESRTVSVRLSWYVPLSDFRSGPEEKPACGEGCDCGAEGPRETYVPWYAGRFAGIHELGAYLREHGAGLREKAARFRDCFFASTLPAEVVEAVSANLSILKTPTMLRQPDGKLWCFEGCTDTRGCCDGSCTHVWNYAQAMAHLFPALERSLRETEFGESQDERGHQGFRSALPVRRLAEHAFHAAADGQLGGIMKIYREWRISGDTEWLRGMWPQVQQSLAYCSETWDPEGEGWLIEPHHNTYDIEFWGPDGMCTSFYLGALCAAAKMAAALGEDPGRWEELAGRARAKMEGELFNGEYFYQRIQWEGLRAGNPVEASKTSFGGGYSAEGLELLQQEGPKYQYGTGCLSDGVLGLWLAEVSGVGSVLEEAKVASHLEAVFRHNFKRDLADHANPQRPGYAQGHEGGLLLCSWPRGGALSLPFPYSNEIWTGIEYHVATHLMRRGYVQEGLEIVRTARSRHDGRVRNPFNEYECGHWYGRALSGWALLYGLSGARYDAVEQVLYLAPRVEGDFRAFLCTAGGYGLVGMQGGEPVLEVWEGEIPVQRIEVTKT